ncbi:TPA: fimbrial protein [Serratia marcescens]|uniref:fimbrial protein n=1 Tax=Serratia sp. CC22-02 TaxID=1378076 RepID=UPI00240352BC|nr:fimbrial protein [Serratia sp. CC22-02]SMP62829.1 Pilin (type 1 fimbria component protein) [Serratia sp. CC22-02]
MIREKVSVYGREYQFGMLRYYAAVGGLILMMPLSLVTLFWLLPDAKAMDNWQVDGVNGVLYVRGALTESACRLEMDSARQDIWLGEISTGQLERPGERAIPAVVKLRLRDCLRTSARNRDKRSGMLSWSQAQPSVRVSFRAVADADNPQLVKVLGVKGVGLRMLDVHDEDVRLGSRGKPLWLSPGDNVLNYRIAAERTVAPLQAGSYQSTIDFHLSYD